MARYNAFVDAGRDEDFGREHLPAPIAEPPYYAIENHPVTLITFAGVDVDDRLRVRRADGSTIPGLFAIGEVIGSAAVNGNAFCSGMCLTPALAFGRALGERVDFSEAGSVIDVGGGSGTLLLGLMERWPHLRGTLLELPDVIVHAGPILEARSILAEQLGHALAIPEPGQRQASGM